MGLEPEGWFPPFQGMSHCLSFLPSPRNTDRQARAHTRIFGGVSIRQSYLSLLLSALMFVLAGSNVCSVRLAGCDATTVPQELRFFCARFFLLASLVPIRAHKAWRQCSWLAVCVEHAYCTGADWTRCLHREEVQSCVAQGHTTTVHTTSQTQKKIHKACRGVRRVENVKNYDVRGNLFVALRLCCAGRQHLLGWKGCLDSTCEP